MTISTNDQKVNKKIFDENFDRIFGGHRTGKSSSYRQDPITGELIECEKIRRSVNAPAVMRDIKEFRSPIDQSIISTRSQLAAHNKRHGVTDMRDYGNGYIKRKETERVNAGQRYLKKTRVEDIKRAIDIHS